MINVNDAPVGQAELLQVEVLERIVVNESHLRGSLELALKKDDVIASVSGIVKGFRAGNRFKLAKVSHEESGSQNDRKTALNELFSLLEEHISEFILCVHDFSHWLLVLNFFLLIEEFLVLDLHVVRVEANEILVEIESETHVLMSINIHVIVI